MSRSVRFLSEEKFAVLRRSLQEAGYNDAALCSRAQVSTVYEVLESETRLQHKPPLADTVDALMWVLLEGRPASRGSWNRLVSGELTELLAATGLLVEQADDYACPLALYPVENLYVISDRDSSIVDSVYPALVENTGRFLDVIPRSCCDNFLEVCAGTGIAALIAARDFAAQSYAFDISDRSVQFAEFNRQLNGLDNMTNSAGDLYAPAGLKTFDRIVAHPPYVPVLKPKAIFHDGGDDGEQIVRRTVEGLPAHLAPGGEFTMLAMGSDRKDAPYEDRVREWLGEAEAEFDIGLVTRRIMDPAEFVSQSVMQGKSDSSEIGQWKKVFGGRGVTALVYGTLLIRRKTEDRPAFTVRRQNSAHTTRAAMDWLIDWEGLIAGGTGQTQLLDAALTAAPGIELRVVNRLQDSNWAPTGYLMEAEYPFSMELKPQPWMIYLLSNCDGKKSGRELWQQLIAEEVIFPGTPENQFASALALLASGGFLHL